MPQITGTVITLNEEENIKGCLESMFRVCDEVIVVDSISSDKTVELAREMGAKVYIQEFLGHGLQKDYGVPLAKHDWILSIDADERLDDDVIECVKSLDLANSPYDGFAFNRKSFLGNKWMKVWYPEYVVRLYNKQKARYSPVACHAKVEAKKVKKLPCALLHYAFKDYRDYAGRTVSTSARVARQLFDNRTPVSSFSPILHLVGGFMKRYFVKRGFLYGVDGLNVSIISAFYAYMKYAFLLEMYKKEQAREEGSTVSRKPEPQKGIGRSEESLKRI